MTLLICTEKIRATLDKHSERGGLNATLKFDCGDVGVVFVNGKVSPHQVDNDNLDADCTITLTLENLMMLLAGELNPVSGFMTGKLKVAGDMSIAMRLQKVL